MSEPERRSVLDGHLVPGHHGAVGTDPVRLQEILCDVVDISARRGHEAQLRAAMRAHLGFELPALGASLGDGRLLALAVAPGIWSIVAAPATPGELAASLKVAAANMASIVDTGHGLTLFKLGGTRARHVLAKGCRLDLHPSTFQPGQVARTIIAQIPITLWQVDAEPSFALAAPLTFAHSFFRFLLSASAETGCTILPRAEDRLP